MKRRAFDTVKWNFRNWCPTYLYL